MRVRVLGKSPAWQDVDGACSGYLIEEGDFRLLLECGNGVFGKLRKQIDYTDLNACVISHCHAAHTLDLVPYSYALAFAPRQQPVPVAHIADEIADEGIFVVREFLLHLELLELVARKDDEAARLVAFKDRPDKFLAERAGPAGHNYSQSGHRRHLASPRRVSIANRNRGLRVSKPR